ncbi:hypothetical protein QCA50_017671 [Cerrena zonata]|uniref:Uncharacterized protein n=1 Tax=Cerrena zonata TaxID=2478898 RepID=A0AAW0FM51_9APHY
MSDLDDDLLALAGAGSEEEEAGVSGGSDSDVPLKRKTKPSGGAAKRRKVEEEEEEEEEEGDDDEEEGDDDEGEEEELVNPYPLEGKYKDEEDRENLLDMDEIEREQVLFERSQEMEKYNERKYLLQRAKQQQQQSNQTNKKATRSSNRSKATTGAKSSKLDKLSELRKQREQRTTGRRRDEDFEDEEDEDLEEEEEEEEDEEDEDEGYGEDEVVWGSGSRNKTKTRSYERATFEDIRKIKNKNQTKEFPINIFSDGEIEREEFDRYVFELLKTNEELPYKEEVEEISQRLNNLMNRSLNDHDINEMIERKQKLQGNIQGFDAVFQKAKLMDQLKISKQQRQTGDVKKIINKLKEIDEILINQTKQHNNSKSLNTMSKVNERNRKLNQENIRKAEIKSSQLKKIIDANEGGDPFSRLKTQTKVFYQDLMKQENEKAINEAKMNYDNLIAEKSELESKIATSTYRILGNMDKMIKDIDINIEIDI